MIPVEAQFYALVAMILFGIVMGLSFDIYRELRYSFKLKSLGTNIWDLLVWLIFIVLAYAVLLYINYGEVRLYIFMAIALGLLVYFRFFSRMARKPIKIILFILLKLLSLLWKIIKIPFAIIQRVLMFPANLVSLVILKIFGPIKRLPKSLRNRFKQKSE
jgi:spore cortex biosynthesis protein YabQ